MKNIIFDIENVQSYTHQGERDYQEDTLTTGNHYWLVSDGMGGHAKGDVASQIVATTLTEQLNRLEEQDAAPSKHLEPIIQHLMEIIVQQLNDYAEKEPSAYKMGATLAMVLLRDNQLHTIHVGDSRVYHFSASGEIKYVTKDHSFVQELMDGGIITPEQAANHPRRNAITRVLQAKKGLKVKADIHTLENVEIGDKLLICSDGVLEAWTDDGLSIILGQQFSNKKIMKEIEKHCAQNSSDNNTAIIATITEKIAPLETKIIKEETNTDEQPPKTTNENDNTTKSTNN